MLVAGLTADGWQPVDHRDGPLAGQLGGRGEARDPGPDDDDTLHRHAPNVPPETIWTSPGGKPVAIEHMKATPAMHTAPWQRPPVARVRFRTASIDRAGRGPSSAAAISAALTCSQTQTTWP